MKRYIYGLINMAIFIAVLVGMEFYQVGGSCNTEGEMTTCTTDNGHSFKLPVSVAEEVLGPHCAALNKDEQWEGACTTELKGTSVLYTAVKSFIFNLNH